MQHGRGPEIPENRYKRPEAEEKKQLGNDQMSQNSWQRMSVWIDYMLFNIHTFQQFKELICL